MSGPSRFTQHSPVLLFLIPWGQEVCPYSVPVPRLRSPHVAYFWPVRSPAQTPRVHHEPPYLVSATRVLTVSIWVLSRLTTTPTTYHYRAAQKYTQIVALTNELSHQVTVNLKPSAKW